MVSNLPLYISAILLSLTVSFINALPATSSMSNLQTRLVGSLSCKVVKTGKLQLYNSKTSKSQGVTLKNNYRLNTVLAGRAKPESVQGIGNPKLLSSYKGVKGDSFEFLACTESQRPGFEDFDPENNGVYYGHLSPAANTKNCATYRSLYADEAYLTSEACNYSDDSGSPFSYFTYSPANGGEINFLDYTGPNGGKPQDHTEGEFDFGPGSSKKSPAVYVHDGSSNFSDWVLQLV